MNDFRESKPANSANIHSMPRVDASSQHPIKKDGWPFSRNIRRGRPGKDGKFGVLVRLGNSDDQIILVTIVREAKETSHGANSFD
jgi:hypothetical protein